MTGVDGAKPTGDAATEYLQALGELAQLVGRAP